MAYSFKTDDSVCSESISFSIEDGKIRSIHFEGGCDGNTQGIARLADGMDAEEVVRRLKGIRCGFKKTSCPDQLASAIEKVLKSPKTETRKKTL